MIKCYDKKKKISPKEDNNNSLFNLVVPLAMVTVRPMDLISTDYRTHQLVYRCTK